MKKHRNKNPMADMDYWHKLSPSEKQWLSKFKLAYYDNMFDSRNSEWTREDKRERSNANNAARRDVYAKSLRVSAKKAPK